jgi:hypothetical protein
MSRTPILFLIPLLAACRDDAAEGELIPVPSGREVRLHEVITNAPGPEGATARFRFIAPGLVMEDIQTSADDMLALCETFALPRTEAMVPPPSQIVISLAAAPVPFGEAAPDVVQFFEGYRAEGGACIWVAF